jgi:hypothetical protein
MAEAFELACGLRRLDVKHVSRDNKRHSVTPLSVTCRFAGHKLLPGPPTLLTPSKTMRGALEDVAEVQWHLCLARAAQTLTRVSRAG